jgi:GlpG protein
MRQIVSISNRNQAELFADHLRSCGIACTVDNAGDGFRVWVHDDDRVAEAKAEVADFLANPNHERYRDASKRAMARFHKDVAEQKAIRRHVVNLADEFEGSSNKVFPVTYGLIGLMLASAIFVGFMTQHNEQRLDRWWFSNDGTLAPILRGEYWRLVTPIFLHGDIMHLTFNMLMIYQLGLLIESRLGSAKLLSMVLAIAVFSNFAEFMFHSPWFGGMSGVNYGLFGYCWIRGRLDPRSGFALQQQAVTMMLVWFLLCVFGIIPNVANWVHGAGLLMGVLIAFFGTLTKSLLRRN